MVLGFRNWWVSAEHQSEGDCRVLQPHGAVSKQTENNLYNRGQGRVI